MDLKAKLVEKESKKGNKYLCIEIKISDTYTKTVFLEQAELELIKLYYNSNK